MMAELLRPLEDPARSSVDGTQLTTTEIGTPDGTFTCLEFSNEGGSRQLVITDGDGDLVPQPDQGRYPFSERLGRTAASELNQALSRLREESQTEIGEAEQELFIEAVGRLAVNTEATGWPGVASPETEWDMRSAWYELTDGIQISVSSSIGKQETEAPITGSECVTIFSPWYAARRGRRRSWNDVFRVEVTDDNKSNYYERSEIARLASGKTIVVDGFLKRRDLALLNAGNITFEEFLTRQTTREDTTFTQARFRKLMSILDKLGPDNQIDDPMT